MTILKTHSDLLSFYVGVARAISQASQGRQQEFLRAIGARAIPEFMQGDFALSEVLILDTEALLRGNDARVGN